MIPSADRETYNGFQGSLGFDSDMGEHLERKIGVLKCTYDFAAQGGAVAAITMKRDNGDDATLPSGAIILGGIVHVVTAVLSTGSATVALATGQTAADLLAATGKASLTLNALIDMVPVNTAATAIRLTAARTIKATIGTEVLTAGKIVAFIHYVLST